MATLQLKERLPIAHEPKPVGSVVLVVKVLATDFVDELLVVDNATRIHRRDFAVNRSALVPRSTPTGPDCSLQKLLDVDIVLLQHIRLDRE